MEESVQRIVEKTGRTVEQARASLTATNPQGRFIQPQEVAAAVLGLRKSAASNRYIRALGRLKDALAGLPEFAEFG